ncbi:MAG: signal recognition particle protein Srp19 [Thermoplasmata archaeon]|nr:signal recognition particle protein Srp19 [Thermoplasmata archaeon]
MPDHFYVYPAYLDGASPRSLGRRVPAGSATTDTTLEEIVAAAAALGAKATSEPDKQYPPQFHKYAGRVKIAKRPGVTKTAFLRDLAKEIHRRRGNAGKD